MDVTQYRFGAFRLVPGARELWKDGQLVHLPRRGFDCLVYLIEHRERAVGRDEMVAALWGRVDATDSQVNQVVLRARLAVDDDGQAQQAIRTVPGFGYRWIVPVEIDPGPDCETTSTVVEAGHEVASPPSEPLKPASPRRIRRDAAFAVLAVLAAIVIGIRWMRPSLAPQSADAHRAALAVLPFDVAASGETGWVRLGAMDLAAERLRNAGLPVPPSDSVVAALHVAGEPLDETKRANLLRMLGAASLVQGRVKRGAGGWKVELETQGSDGAHHRASAEQADVIEATRQAADLLSAALGHRPAASDRESDGPNLALQQAQAALLANELDTARSILDAIPEPARNDPLVRAKLAQIDFRAGRLDAARAALDTLLADPALAARQDARVLALTTRGFIDIRREDCAPAEASFDRALSAIAERTSRERGVALAARGLARACLRHFDTAVADLGAARSLLAAAGDRLGDARVDNYFGILETQRHHLADAVAYFTAAATANETFGIVEGQRANLAALFLVQARLLRWPDALATSERIHALQPRIDDPALLVLGEAFRAMALTALGRERDADALLAETAARWPDARGALTRFLYLARAKLAAQRGDGAVASAEAERAATVWPPSSDDDADERAHLDLLRQRASILAGTPRAADVPSEGDNLPADALLARAEWELHEKRPAESDLHAAWARAETDGTPAEIARVARTYADLLINANRFDEAAAVTGRVAPWAAQDFDCAVLQVRLFHATGRMEAWTVALHQAHALAGERVIPKTLLETPSRAGTAGLSPFATDPNAIRSKME